MKYETAAILIAFFGLTISAPVPEAKNVFRVPTPPARMLRGREVPQEHSHNQFLDTVRTSLATNNPAGIQDPVFGLLGSAAAVAGQGTITDTDCLQEATADQAFTNAKAAGDVAGMTAALVYRAIERNTGKVGLASAACTSITAVNPEIAAVTQHQDPASDGAAATNKAITLELAKQISSIGGDPQTALESGTFAPGDLSDDTGKGNTCDTEDDTLGCIFSQNLLVEDATADEITAAVAGLSAPTPAASNSTVAATTPQVANTTASDCPAPVASTTATKVAVVRNSALDFGSCSDPSIAFGPGFDGRTEDSFEPSNIADFNHGSADNIGIVASFICGQLSSSCDASAAAVAACTTGETAASSQTGQAAADAFNSALGVSAAASSTTTAASTSAASPAASTAASPAASPAADTTTATGSNAQTFTGTLGGAPPQVENVGGDRPFSVDGDTFVNAAAAIQRSCSVQHNACATAANSGAISGGEAQCEAQENACNDANTA